MKKVVIFAMVLFFATVSTVFAEDVQSIEVNVNSVKFSVLNNSNKTINCLGKVEIQLAHRVEALVKKVNLSIPANSSATQEFLANDEDFQSFRSATSEVLCN